MARRQRIALTLHPVRHGAYWALTIRTEDGHRLSDRRLSFGHLPYGAGVEGPQHVIPLLQRAVWALERSHGAPSAPEGLSGAPGGGGGRVPGQGAEGWSRPLPEGGQGLDVPLPGL